MDSSVPPVVAAAETLASTQLAFSRVGNAYEDWGTALDWPSTTTRQDRAAPTPAPTVHVMVVWAVVTLQAEAGKAKLEFTLGMAHADTTVVP
jgi:hypothetical protein